MHSQNIVENALYADRLRSNSCGAPCTLSREFGRNLRVEDTDSDADDDIWKPDCSLRRASLREAGKQVIKANAKEGGVNTSMVLKSALLKLDRRRDKEHNDFISGLLGNAPLMAKTTRALRAVRDPLFAYKGFDRTALFNTMARVLHEMKVSVASTCWDQTVLRCKEELSGHKVKYESMRRVFQDSRESYLKEVAALRDQVRMRGKLDDELPSVDIVSYFDPEYALLPGEQAFLLDAVREKVKMMIERNPKVENCIDFGQFERLQNRVESNALQDVKQALKRTLARLKEAEAIIAGKGKQEDIAPKSGAPALAKDNDKIIEALEALVEDLREQLSSEQNALKVAKKDLLGLEAERDDLSQSLRNMLTEQIMHKTELNRLQERLSHHELLTHDAEKEIANLQHVVQAQELEIKQLKSRASRQKQLSQQSTEIHFPEETLPSPADMAAGGHRRATEDKADSEELKQMQDERDAALARCGDLTAKFDEVRQVVRCHIEQFLELKSEAVLDGADSIMEQAKILGCVNVEGAAEGARICECGNILVRDAIFCRKCGTKWEKPAQIAKEICADKDTLASLTVQLEDIDQHSDAAMTKLREVLQLQEERRDADVNADVEWLEKLVSVQKEVDSHKWKKLRIEAMILETRVRVANRASLEMPIADNHCTCNCAEELRAIRKLLDRTRHLCTESIASLQHVVLDNSVVNATLNKMRDTLGKAADVAQSVAADNPDVRFVLKTINEARAQSVFSRLYYNADGNNQNERREERRNRLLEKSVKTIYQLDPRLPTNVHDVSKHAEAPSTPSIIRKPLQGPGLVKSRVASAPKIKPFPLEITTNKPSHSARESILLTASIPPSPRPGSKRESLLLISSIPPSPRPGSKRESIPLSAPIPPSPRSGSTLFSRPSSRGTCPELSRDSLPPIEVQTFVIARSI